MAPAAIRQMSGRVSEILAECDGLFLLFPWLELYTLIRLGIETSALTALLYVFGTLLLGLGEHRPRRRVARPDLEEPGQAIDRRLRVEELEVLTSAETPPFVVEDRVNASEELRLTHRYLDLRRARMQRNIILRHRVIKHIRDFLDARGFVEIETQHWLGAKLS